MRIYFLRHGDASWPNWQEPDDERPLTKKGKKEMKRVAKFFANLASAPAAIVTSPLPRASQTAKVMAKALDLDFDEDELLRPGFDAPKLSALVQKYQGQDVMVVGHEPDFSGTIGALTGASVRLSKASIARVDIDDPNLMRGTLVWLLQPKIMAS